ncbi:ABC transporter substrate-binding protein [Paenibacillus alvei]|uniref:ABC transporter substrate-binding protein n=1 Tax=Paenibacillus alvei TaxID=44250 RepID=UPI000428CC4C|nr:ABC transporter substrate-binding protein [Paenibacillus alvei]
MSWNELFALAKRLRAAEDIQHTTKSFSFYYAGTDLFSLAMEIASSQNVRYLNSDGTKITINTDNWKDIFDPLINGSRKGYIRTQSDISNLENPYNDGGPFAKGQAAMTIDYSYLLNDLKHVNFKWDIVTIPVDPVHQGSVSAIQPNTVFAISTNSNKVEESWKFIEFIHSEQYARTLQKSGSYFVLPAREGLTTKFNDINLKAFYSVPPMDEPRYRLSFKKSEALYSLANDELKRAITNTDLDTKILLTELETKLQLILKQN